MKLGVVSTKKMLHMPQLLGRFIDLFHACSRLGNKEEFLKVSRTGQQFGANWGSYQVLGTNVLGKHLTVAVVELS